MTDTAAEKEERASNRWREGVGQRVASQGVASVVVVGGEGSSSGAGDANMCPVPSSRLVRLMIGRECVSGRILYKAGMIIAVQGKYAAVSGFKRREQRDEEMYPVVVGSGW